MAEVLDLNGKSVAIAMDWLELPPDMSRARAAVQNHIKTFGARRHIVRESYTGAVMGIVPMSDGIRAMHAGAVLAADALGTLDSAVVYLRKLVDERWWCCLSEKRLPVAGSDLVMSLPALLHWLDQLPEIGEAGAVQIALEGSTVPGELSMALDRFSVSTTCLEDRLGDPDVWRDAKTKLSGLTRGEKAGVAASFLLASALAAGGYVAYQMHVEARAREEAAKIIPPPELYRRAVSGYLSTQVLIDVGSFSQAAWDQLRRLDVSRKGWVLRSASCSVQPALCKAEYHREPFGVEAPFDGERLTVTSRTVDKVAVQWPFVFVPGAVVSASADAAQLATLFNTERESTRIAYTELSNDLSLGFKSAPAAEPAQVAGQGKATWTLQESKWTVEGTAPSLALLSRFPYPAYADSFDVSLDPKGETKYRVAGRVWNILNAPQGSIPAKQEQRT